jgi:exonuclease V
MPYLETAGSGEDDNGEDDFGSDIPYDDELEEALRKAETNAAVVDIEDAVAISPLEQFKRGNYLSVSDLVGTVWCEVQYD